MEFGICVDGRYIQDHFPGIGRYTFNLIDALARIAPDEKFFALHNSGLKNTRYDLAALARYRNVELVQTNVRTFSLQEQFQLPLTNYQLLHSPYYIKPYFTRTPSVVTIFDLIPFHFPAELSNSALRLLFRAGINLAVRTSTRVLVPSISARDDLVAALNVAREKLTVIPLAADARFRPVGAPERERVRTIYNLPEKYILYVGINKPHKNLDTLIAAYQRTGVDAALVVAGAWDARYANEQRGGGAGEKIRFIHNIQDSDLPALYSSATVFVFPSLYEGFGLPLLEAMACGVPCISSNASSLPEVGGDATLYFDPRNADALAQLIARVGKDPGLQEEMRGKSLARAREFSWERTARETLAVYADVKAKHFHKPIPQSQ